MVRQGKFLGHIVQRQIRANVELKHLNNALVFTVSVNGQT